MEFSSEARTFLTLMLTGAVLGCVFDVCRMGRNTFKLRSLGTSVTDILFWILAALVVFAVLVGVNQGELRFYVFLALIAGAVSYFRFLSRYVLTFLIRLTRVLNKFKTALMRILQAFVLTFITKPARFVSKTASKPINLFGRAFRRTYQRFNPPPKN
jgi:spore cortex biosynthesis protein YabQ